MKRAPILIMLAAVFFIGSCNVGSSDKSNTSKTELEPEIVKYPSGKVFMETYFLTKDSIKTKIVVKFDNDSNTLKDVYYKVNTKVEGVRKIYHDNGELAEIGEFVDGKKRGFFIYYDQDGHLKCKREFVLLNDAEKGYYLNQVINFDKNNDTIKSGSIYFNILARDTIRYGEEFDLKISVPAPLFSKCGFVICEYDSLYNLPSLVPCDTVYMNGFIGTYKTIKYHMGENVIRGQVFNYDLPIDSYGKIKATGHEMYFSRKFYVQ